MKNTYNDHFKKLAQKKLIQDKKTLQSTQGSKVKPSSQETKSLEMKARKLLVPKVSRKKRPTINLPLVGILTLILFVSAGYLYFPKQVHHFIDNIHIQLGPIADAEEGSPNSKSEGQEKNKTTKGDVPENNSQTKEDVNKINAANLKNWTDEELSHFSKLNERKRQLDQREQQLAKLEEELHKQKIEIESRIKRLEELRGQISKVLTDRVNIDQEKVVKLVDFYSNMKPQQAAKIFESINEDLAVEILGKMKKKDAASIMNLINPDKAQVLSEKFAGYKR